MSFNYCFGFLTLDFQNFTIRRTTEICDEQIRSPRVLMVEQLWFWMGELVIIRLINITTPTDKPRPPHHHRIVWRRATRLITIIQATNISSIIIMLIGSLRHCLLWFRRLEKGFMLGLSLRVSQDHVQFLLHQFTGHRLRRVVAKLKIHQTVTSLSLSFEIYKCILTVWRLTST